MTTPPQIDRRAFATALAAALAAAGLAAAFRPQPALAHADIKPLEGGPLAMLLFPGFTALDLAAPQYAFSAIMGPPVLLVAKTKDPVMSDTGMAILPTHTFAECPSELTLIFSPGAGEGAVAAMRDEETLKFLADRGSRARFVTSVCTGSLILGAAGLLQGYRATCHWVARDVLASLGATPVNARVVTDRNRITGAGVTSGFDFGLNLVSQLRDPDYAKAVQLLAEYHPEPMFDAGTPERAPEDTTKTLRDMFAPFLKNARAAAEEAAVRLARTGATK